MSETAWLHDRIATLQRALLEVLDALDGALDFRWAPQQVEQTHLQADRARAEARRVVEAYRVRLLAPRGTGGGER